MSPGDLVYYDKCGGPYWTVFPFSEKDMRGLGIVVSEVFIHEYQGEDLRSVWIVDENGSKVEFALEYLELAII